MPVEKIPSLIEHLLTPKLNEISGDVKALNVKTESLRKEMLSKFEGLDYRFEAINTQLDSLEKHSLL